MSRNPYPSINQPLEDDEKEYYVVPAIPVDHEVHTPEHPFCDDPTCFCHDDPDAIEQVNQDYQDGLLSAADATRTVGGKTI